MGALSSHLFVQEQSLWAQPWPQWDPQHRRRPAGPMTSFPGPDSETPLRENVPKVMWLVSGRTGADLEDLASPMRLLFYSNNAAIQQCVFQYKSMQDHGSFQNHLQGLLLGGYESLSLPLGHAFCSPVRSLADVTDPISPGKLASEAHTVPDVLAS